MYSDTYPDVRTLRSHVHDSLVAIESLRCADGVPRARTRVEDLEEQLKRAQEHLEEEKRRVMFEKAVHDAKHEGLVALLSKVENTLWG